MDSDDWERTARGADVALEILGRAYHALAVVYELSNPGAYAALHGMMMPYLNDGFGPEETRNVADPRAADLVSSALERVRCVLDDVRCDVSAVRIQADESTC